MVKRAVPLFFLFILGFTIYVFTFSASAAPLTVLKVGDRGNDVADLQRDLRKLGFDPGPIDGFFGDLTKTAVLNYQASRKLLRDGIAGPLTFSSIKRDIDRATADERSASQTGGAHIVKKGETLSLIAARFGLSTSELARYNDIRNPDLIRIGQVIKVPSKSTSGVQSKSEGSAQASKSTLPAETSPQTSDQLQLNRLIPPRPQGEGRSEETTSKNRYQKKVALTFDDGPEPKYTPVILDILNRAGIKGTFFVVGEKAKAHPELIQRMCQEGHDVENHSFTHRNAAELDEKELESEIRKTSDLIKTIAGRATRYFRPPGGAFGKSVENAARNQNHNVVLWNNVGGSALAQDSRTLAQRMISYASDGAILLLYENQATVEALPSIIDELRAQKFEFGLLSGY